MQPDTRFHDQLLHFPSGWEDHTSSPVEAHMPHLYHHSLAANISPSSSPSDSSHDPAAGHRDVLTAAEEHETAQPHADIRRDLAHCQGEVICLDSPSPPPPSQRLGLLHLLPKAGTCPAQFIDLEASSGKQRQQLTMRHVCVDSTDAVPNKAVPSESIRQDPDTRQLHALQPRQAGAAVVVQDCDDDAGRTVGHAASLPPVTFQATQRGRYDS